VKYLLLFINDRPSNQHAIIGVGLSHKKVETHGVNPKHVATV
jgi:hypothetical protein